MNFADSIRVFEEKRFLDLTREDAVALADWLDGQTGSKAGHALQKTDASIDQAAAKKHPWFLAYVLATEYVDTLPFSHETSEYLKNHPVVPGDEFLDETNPPETVRGTISPETAAEETPIVVATENTKKSPEVSLPNPAQVPAKAAGPPERRLPRTTPSETASGPDPNKYSKITECFIIVMENVAKCTKNVEEYYDSVVLSHIFHKNEAARILLVRRAPGSMDESLFALASLDDGHTLRATGLDMVNSVVRAAIEKYGQKSVNAIISKSIKPAGSGTLTDAYMKCFPRYPATLQLILKSLKKGIMALKR